MFETSIKFLARPNTKKGGSWYFEMAKDSWGIQSTQLGFGETHIHTKLSIASTTFLKGLQPKFEKFLPRFSLCQTKRLKSFILLLQFEKRKGRKKNYCRAHHQSFFFGRCCLPKKEIRIIQSHDTNSFIPNEIKNQLLQFLQQKKKSQICDRDMFSINLTTLTKNKVHFVVLFFDRQGQRIQKGPN